MIKKTLVPVGRLKPSQGMNRGMASSSYSQESFLDEDEEKPTVKFAAVDDPRKSPHAGRHSFQRKPTGFFKGGILDLDGLDDEDDVECEDY